MPFLLVLSTVSTRAEGRKIAKALLKKRLAACVNISSPVESHYRWKGKIEKAGEFLLMIKTRRALFARLEREIRAQHSYSVPEIVALTLEKGSRRYLSWLAEETVSG